MQKLLSCLPVRGSGWGEAEIAAQARLMMAGVLAGQPACETPPPPAADAAAAATAGADVSEEELLGAWHDVPRGDLPPSGEREEERWVAVLACELVPVSDGACEWDGLQVAAAAPGSTLARMVGWTAVALQAEPPAAAGSEQPPPPPQRVHQQQVLLRALLLADGPLPVLFAPPPQGGGGGGGAAGGRQLYAFCPKGGCALLRRVQRGGDGQKPPKKLKAATHVASFSASGGGTLYLQKLSGCRLAAARRDPPSLVTLVRLPADASAHPVLSEAEAAERGGRRTALWRGLRQKVVRVAVALNGAVVRRVKPKVLLHAVVEAAESVSAAAAELARGLTYDELIERGREGGGDDDGDGEDELKMLQAWARANANGDEVVDAKELADLNLNVGHVPPELREALAQRQRAGSPAGLPFAEFQRLWEGLSAIPELRPAYDALLRASAAAAATAAPSPAAPHPPPPSFKEFCREAKCPRANPALRDVATDLSQPLARYFIASSHNTYLSGHQLWGRSSADQYRGVLRQGARCVEIDVWDEPQGGQGLVVTHGLTLTSRIALEDTLRSVADAAFEHTDMPLLISVENHASAARQAAMAASFSRAFGSRLLPRAACSGVLTPDGLRRRVLIKSAVSGAADPAWAALIALPGGDGVEGEPNRVVSVSEKKLDAVGPRDTAAVLHRLYPKGTRFDSDNYDAQEAFASGVQMAAMNYQRQDARMRAYAARFRHYNGGCGFFLKPEGLLGDRPFSDGCSVRVDVLRAWRLPTGFAPKGISDPYVTVELRGLAHDVAACRHICTSPVKLNGFNPAWAGAADATGVFTVQSAALSLLHVRILDHDTVGENFFADTALAEAFLPMACLNEGVRSVPLRSAKDGNGGGGGDGAAAGGAELPESGLLCRFTFLHGGAAAAAAAEDAEVRREVYHADGELAAQAEAVAAGAAPPAAAAAVPTKALPGGDAGAGADAAAAAGDDWTGVGFPVDVDGRPGWVVGRRAAATAVVAFEDDGGSSRCEDVAAARVAARRPPPNGFAELLAIPRVRWLWERIVAMRAGGGGGGDRASKGIVRAAEVAGRFAAPGLEASLASYLGEGEEAASAASAASFLARPEDLPPITADEALRAAGLAARMEAERAARERRSKPQQQQPQPQPQAAASLSPALGYRTPLPPAFRHSVAPVQTPPSFASPPFAGAVSALPPYTPPRARLPPGTRDPRPAYAPRGPTASLRSGRSPSP